MNAREIEHQGTVAMTGGESHTEPTLEEYLDDALNNGGLLYGAGVSIPLGVLDASASSAKNLTAESPPVPRLGVIAPDGFEQKLGDFLDALDEWGCQDNAERAQAILEFQRTGYDLDAYLVEHPDRSKSELN